MTALDVLQFFVSGIPKTKGSKTVRSYRSKHWLQESSKGLKGWMEQLRAAAIATINENHAKQFAGPVSLVVRFHLPKSASNRNVYPVEKGRNDLDKLLRAVMDGLTGIVYRDDAQVIDVETRKRYVGPGFLGGTGCWIEVRERR